MTGDQGAAAQAISALIPLKREVIYEILRDQIQADVSDWANYKKGKSDCGAGFRDL